MKKLLSIVVLMVLTSCGATTQLAISETPQTTREAIVYEDRVVVVTKTTVTRERFDEIYSKWKNQK